MAGIFVTDTGFQKKTLVEIKAELETAFQGIFGDDIDLDPEGPFGQIIGLLSNREANLWDGAEEIYTSRDPGSATGSSLDNISAETGVRRIDATPTTTRNVILYGVESTVVAAGKQAKQENNDLLHSLQSAVTITKAIARHVELDPDAPSGGGGEVYTVTINGTPYTYTASPGDGKKEVIDDLVSDITGGSWTGVASNVNDEQLKLLDADTDFSAIWTATLTQSLLGSGGDFEADETGPNTVPANTLDTIATPVTGWDDVNNPDAGTVGRDVETDDQLRIRRAETFLSGNATDEAIRSALLNEVTGVQTASVRSNRKLENNSQKVVFDANFIAGNNIDFTVNGAAVTTVPFNTDQSTTMADIKTQIEADVANTTVVIDLLDSNNRTLVITLSTVTIIDVTVSVSGGASQAGSDIIFSDSDGRPPKSFEAIVEGGTDADIAEEIWETQPSGIESYGGESEVIQDSEGRNQTINFSRPTNLYIHVKVKRDLYTEETYPANGDDLIKAEIVAWALTEYDPGVDVIRQRLNIPIYEVPGIGDVEVTIDATPNPGDVPAYAADDIPVSGRELAVFATTRITVEVLTS